MNTDLAREYVDLLREKKETEAHLARVKSQLAAREEVLLQEFDDEGVTQIAVEGSDGRVMKLYRHTQTWASRAKGVDEETFFKRLEEAGLGDLVQPRVNVQTLSAVVREYDANGEEMPSELATVVKVTQRTSLRGRA